ncbi:MAG: RNA polymerase subunit sigma-24 [Gorillibacterium sp.]|nr:RNA polymerase subunit sigma-24 [Gorillibacterium sp.]
MSEQAAIQQLQEYKRIVGRIKVLERQSVGMGYTVSAISHDDQLQELHKQLRGLPSYMYLSAREQELETAAHAYLDRYPAGIRSQYREVAGLSSGDPEDEQRLRDLTQRIRKVLEARIGTSDGYEEILERMCELQELEVQKEYIDNALNVLDDMYPGYGRLLRLRYLDDQDIGGILQELNIARRTFDRWRPQALIEYGRLIGVA